MLYPQVILFLENIFNHLKENKVDLKKWEIDHICYRTSSYENYEKIKQEIAKQAILLVESPVNGRPIATYKLFEPIRFNDRIISLIEVPAPKKGKETKEGFEHVEVVIDESFDDFIKRNHQIPFNKKGLLKDLNPELEIEFKDCAVKFHHKSLEHIITIEKNAAINEFLDETQLLKTFHKYSPCLSGTLPLGIATPRSDLDILMYSQSLEELRDILQKSFGTFPSFKTSQKEFQEEETLVVSFTYKDLPIELFCQNIPVHKQQANQHFLIEGRLLKILGDDFKKQILDHKKRGIKTEPAFGLELNLENPYEDLLTLIPLSDFELEERFKKESS